MTKEKTADETLVKQPLPLRDYVLSRVGQTWAASDAVEVIRQLDRIDTLAQELWNAARAGRREENA